MNNYCRSGLMLLVLAVGTAACGGAAQPTAAPVPPTVPPTTTSAPPAWTPAQLSKATNQALLKGDLYASLPNWEAGNYPLAVSHGQHMGEELLPLINDDLKAAGVITDLQTIFDQYTVLLKEAGDAATVKAAYGNAARAVDEATAAYLGPLAQDQRFTAAIVAEVLAAIEGEYEEALQDGKIGNLVEYQDGKGYLAVAGERYATLAPMMAARRGPENSAIKAALEKLNAIFPDYMTPPTQPAAEEALEKEVDAVRGALDTALALGLAAGAAETDLIAGSRQAVADAMSAFAAGKGAEAYEKAAAAYLDYFEKIEGTLGQKDQPLVADMEAQFKALRDGIKAGQSPADLQAIAARINAGLDKAAQLLATK